MMRAWTCLLSLSAVAFFTLAPGAAAKRGDDQGRAEQPRAIRALYVTGGGFHEFVKQEGNMSFSYVVDVPWIERLAHAHRDSGVGAVILHGAVHSYRRSETRAWGELIGAFSLRHDSQRPLTVETVAPNHPIMRGMPQKWETIPEELYELERVWPTMVPLAQSFSIESKKPYPIIWTNTHGKAKVFVTSLGHHTEMIANPMYLDMVGRAVLWTTGHLKDDGTPAQGYAAQ